MTYNELNEIAKGNARNNYINEFCAYDFNDIPTEKTDIEMAIIDNEINFDKFGNIT